MGQALGTIDTCDAILSIGTSALVHPAAGFVGRAKARGALALEINRDPTPVTDVVDVSLLGKAGEILPELVRLLRG
jgi:NAD-dependent deacetylase